MESKLQYEVWALGYSSEWECIDIEEHLGTFDSPEEAINKAKTFQKISDVFSEEFINRVLEDGDRLEIVVETVQKDDPSSRNIETLYSQHIE